MGKVEGKRRPGRRKLTWLCNIKDIGHNIDYSDLGVLRSVRTPHWEREKALKSSMETEKFITLKYRDLMVQLASFTLFARIFPLAPLVVLVSNAIDLRVSARRILLYSRRPILRRNLGIGAWYNVLFAIVIAIAWFQIFLGTITSEAILQFTKLAEKNESVVDHLNFEPFEKFRIYAYTPAFGPNASTDLSYELGYLSLKVFPEYDYQTLEKEKGDDTPLHEYLRHIENNYGLYKPSCSCTTFYQHNTWKSTNDYDLMPRRTCYFKVPDSPTIPDYGSGLGNGRAWGAKNPRATNGCHQRLQLATYNARTLREDEKMVELEVELSKIKWDILGLSEVRREGEDTMTLESGHMLYHREGDQLSQGGVGFLFDKTLVNNVVEISSVSNRVAYLVLKLTERYSLKVVQVYAPTSANS
ncbi:unnamed protein product [Plutella xylostella]|uniref:Anoctamin n=1 Tax=Plutella xylostella TaxID=51655 RepID=A0A8S4G640_PLUXY|nr:unnamed protein product [Plutella xylostella]